MQRWDDGDDVELWVTRDRGTHKPPKQQHVNDDIMMITL